MALTSREALMLVNARGTRVVFLLIVFANGEKANLQCRESSGVDQGRDAAGCGRRPRRMTNAFGTIMAGFDDARAVAGEAADLRWRKAAARLGGPGLVSKIRTDGSVSMLLGPAVAPQTASVVR